MPQSDDSHVHSGGWAFFSSLDPALSAQGENPENYCFVIGDNRNLDTPEVKQAQEIFEAAQKTRTGQQFALSGLPICVVPESHFAGAYQSGQNIIAFGEPGIVAEKTNAFLNQTGNDRRVTSDDIRKLQEAAAVEELCHAVVGNNDINVSFGNAAFYPADTAVKLSFVNEAVCSSAGLLAAYQKYLDGESEHWNAMRKWSEYKPVMDAIESSVGKNMDNLHNGAAHLAGYNAWLSDPALKEKYLGMALSGYQSYLEAFQMSEVQVLGAPPVTHAHVAWLGALGHPDINIFALGGPYIAIDDSKVFGGIAPESMERMNMLQEKAESILGQQKAGELPVQHTYESVLAPGITLTVPQQGPSM